MGSSTTWTISQLAREFDVTPRTLRYYEDEGIVAPTRCGRNRIYSARDRHRLRITLRGRRLGLSLAEIRSVLDIYGSPQDTRRQIEHYLALLQRHREVLEHKREDIELSLTELREQEQQCRVLLEQIPADPATAGG